MREKKKQIIILICVIILIVLALLFWMIKNQPESYSGGYKESDRQDTIEYDGKEYQYNDHLSNYLFMGIDTRDFTSTYETQAGAGQADAIYLVSHDRVKGTVVCLSIPRDTITSIRILSVGGDDMGTTRDHINLQYAFGDGKDKSCQLMKEAVSNMLYGIPIQGYCSVNMEGIAIVPTVIGAVEVVVPDESLESVSSEFQKGATVAITEENMERFVRYRDIEKEQSAITRMNRQKVYLKAALEKVKNTSSEEMDVVVELYDALQPYMVTNMGNDLFVKLAEASFDFENGIQDIPGEGVSGEVFDEYHIDDTQLYELILQLFYKEI